MKRRTARPVSSTKAIRELRCGRTPAIQGRSSPRAIPRVPCQVLAKASIAIGGSGWKEYKFEMQSGNAAASSENHLEVTIEKPATLWLQLVSLFPPTYHGRPNGDRIDIMEKLAAMRPTFLRFPGGNYLEGDRIATRFDWKKRIGSLVAVRRTDQHAGDSAQNELDKVQKLAAEEQPPPLLSLPGKRQ